MIRAEVVADSVSPNGDRLTTMVVDLHRFVLAELNTHRAFSRNSASSRAIPLSVTLDRVTNDPAWPIELPCEQPGMQGGALLVDDDSFDARWLLEELHSHTVTMIERYIEAHPDKATRLHKSVLNRYLEPFMWHRAVITSTDWRGFFAQRCSPLAQPEIRAAAEAMRDAMRASVPQVLGYGEWHLPFVGPDDYGTEFDELVELHGFAYVTRAMSVARCARVSYLNEGKRDPRDDLRLFARLLDARPPHASPFEHVATPCNLGVNTPGNFTGWSQFRHVLDLDRLIVDSAR